MKRLIGFFWGVSLTCLIVGFWSHFSHETVAFAILMSAAFIAGSVMLAIDRNI